MAKFGIKPINDYVVIKLVEAEEKTKGGIILTGSAKEKPEVAEVIAIGPGTDEVKIVVKPGDKVIFSPYGGTEVKYKGEEYKVLKQDNIYAVVE